MLRGMCRIVDGCLYPFVKVLPLLLLLIIRTVKRTFFCLLLV